MKKKAKAAPSKEVLERRKAAQAKRAAMRAEMRRKAKENAANGAGSDDVVFVSGK